MIPVRVNGPIPTVMRVFRGDGRDPVRQAEECPACDEPVGTADVALVYVGPGPDPEDQAKARAGRWHTGAAVAVHAACTGVQEGTS